MIRTPFPLGGSLSSTDSAAGVPVLFNHFAGTMEPSDFPSAYMSGLLGGFLQNCLTPANTTTNIAGMAKRKKKKTKDAEKISPSSGETKPKSPSQNTPSLPVAFPYPQIPLDPEFAKLIGDLENSLGMPIWLLVQDGPDDEWNAVSSKVKQAFFDARFFPGIRLERGKKAALLIDSPGGSARSAYEIASLLKKHCGGFTAIIPRRAKSAATLIALGADNIILGEYGELGPLDVQIRHDEREEYISGLDEVQALERLHAFSMSAFDQSMFMLMSRTGMKVSTLIPFVIELVTKTVNPMFANVDVVRYTQISRMLKVGEEYARRLLQNRFDEEIATAIARRLVEIYPEHSFIIDSDEAKNLGLEPQVPNDDQMGIITRLCSHLSGMTAIGRIAEIPSP